MSSYLAQKSSKLLEEVAGDPDGEISPSIYETARVVASAPWLTGHRQRVEFLLSHQLQDGTWGMSNGYGLVPTLSAVDGLLRYARPDRSGDATVDNSIVAVRLGLQALDEILHSADYLPADMIASELIIPALITDINTLQTDSVLPMPAYADHAMLQSLRDSAVSLNPKWEHTLEVFGARAHMMAGVDAEKGNLGCSPAATAAWLGPTPSAHTHPALLSYLRNAATKYGGPVAGVTPITVEGLLEHFEHAWVLGTLLNAGIQVRVPETIMKTLRGALGPQGASVGSGLLTDADTTAATLA